MFKKAFVEKEDYTPAPIVLWTVTIDPSGKKDAKASVILMKFLRARCVYPLRVYWGYGLRTPLVTSTWNLRRR